MNAHIIPEIDKIKVVTTRSARKPLERASAVNVYSVRGIFCCTQIP
jgi:hypothetical protein